MRILLVPILSLALLSAGCAHKKRQASQGNFSALPGVGPSASETPTTTTLAPTTTATPTTTPSPPPSSQQLIVTPDNVLTGKVVSVNQTARFVVLSFPVGHLPPADQQFGVYRRGLKVGQIKITSQQLNEYIVGDILDGDAEAGDEVRNR